MLKTKIIEHYKPPAKTLELLHSIPNIKFISGFYIGKIDDEEILNSILIKIVDLY